jgi:hypothetical protein
MTLTGTGTLTTAGKTFSGVTVNGSGITVTLGAALNTSPRNLTLTQGTFDTANFNVTTGVLTASGSTTRVVTLGSSNITVTSTACNFGGTNITVNAGTSTIQGTATPLTFTGGGNTFYNVSNTANTAGDFTVLGANTFNDLTISATSAAGKTLLLGADQTVNGTLTCAGTSASDRIFVFSDTIGTARTITAAAVSATDCDFRDITIAGVAAPISPTRAGDCEGNSGITFPAAKTAYRVGTNNTWAGSSSWALTSGGAGSNDNFPLPQDTVVIDEATTLTGTLAIAKNNIGTFDTSTRTTGITLNHTSVTTRYGSYTFGSGVTVSGNLAQTFSGRGTMVFTSAGKTITFPITVGTPHTPANLAKVAVEAVEPIQNAENGVIVAKRGRGRPALAETAYDRAVKAVQASGKYDTKSMIATLESVGIKKASANVYICKARAAGVIPRI